MGNYRPICDVWILARPKVRYYGAYPNGFLERARALLGITPYDALLHVCGGAARQYPGKPRGFGPSDKTLDLDPALEPDFVQAALEPLPAYGVYCDPVRQGQPLGWPAIIGDPPYTLEDAGKYAPGKAGTLPPPATALLANMLRSVRPGGRVGLLHYVIPRPPREGAKFVACVGVVVGYGNRGRFFTVFERLSTGGTHGAESLEAHVEEGSVEGSQSVRGRGRTGHESRAPAPLKGETR